MLKNGHFKKQSIEIMHSIGVSSNEIENISKSIIKNPFNYRRKRFNKEFDVKYFKLSCGISLHKFRSSKKIFKELFNILNEKL